MVQTKSRPGRRARSTTPTSPVKSIKRPAHDEAKRQRIKRQQVYRRKKQSQARMQPQTGQQPATLAIDTSAMDWTGSAPTSAPTPSLSSHDILIKKRQRWTRMAEETREIILGSEATYETIEPHQRGVGLVPPPSEQTQTKTYDIWLPIQLSIEGTKVYGHVDPRVALWDVEGPPPGAVPPARTSLKGKTEIEWVHGSTLAASRKVYLETLELRIGPLEEELSKPREGKPTTLGVFCFAKRKRPGSGWLHGGDEQEEYLARSTSLVASLASQNARAFYGWHRDMNRVDASGLNDHAIAYSPGVVVFRKADDDGEVLGTTTRRRARSEADMVTRGQDRTEIRDPEGKESFIPPYCINVASAVAVNHATVRDKHPSGYVGETDFYHAGIRKTMRDRMARVLRCFEINGDRYLVLGAFGCGDSSQNDVAMVAEIWAELLGPGGRFKDAFVKVVFAVRGKIYAQFRKAYELKEMDLDLISRMSE